jgi:hypothetical protein
VVFCIPSPLFGRLQHLDFAHWTHACESDGIHDVKKAVRYGDKLFPAIALAL